MLEQETRKAPLAGDPAADPSDPAARERMRAERRRSREFLDAHYPELFRQYPDQWVGGYLEEVVAVAPTLGELLAQIDALGIPRDAMCNRFMNTNRGLRCWTPFRRVRLS